MFYFVKNDLKIIVKCMREAGVDVSSEAGWQSTDGDAEGKAPEKFWSFNILRAKQQLEIEKSQEANLF